MHQQATGRPAGARGWAALARQVLGLAVGILVCVAVHAHSGCGHDHGGEPKPSYLPVEKRLGGWLW